MAGNWRKYPFFDKDVVSESVTSVLGAPPTCGVAEGGLLVFGDGAGSITICDRDFQIVSKKEKAFRGSILGISYLFDPKNHRRQYVVAVGDDSFPSDAPTSVLPDGSSVRSNLNYFVKVYCIVNQEWSKPIQNFPIQSSQRDGSVFNAGGGMDSTLGGGGGAAPTTTAPAIGGGSGSSGSDHSVPSLNNELAAFAVMPDGSQIAIGFTSGAVLVYTGQFLKESNGRPPSASVLMGRYAFPVAQLFFCEKTASTKSGASNSDRQIRLFTVFDTESVNEATGVKILPSSAADAASASAGPTGIIVFDVSLTISSTGAVFASGSRRPVHSLDERGATRMCASYVKDQRELVVGREEGVFSYSVEDRGGAAGFEGIKQCVTSVGRYILVASLVEKTKRNNINIYDLRNKFISFSGQIAAGEKIVLIMHDGGSAYVLTSSNMLFRYREKDTANKIEVLLKKALFPLAIALASEEHTDLSEVMKLNKLYGDHLYKKGEFDNAIQQYVTAIGYVQSSYVIRRYLDPHRIYNLIYYLEKLQDRGQATKDHKALLLTCYTKIRDEAKIISFLKSASQLLSDIKTSSTSNRQSALTLIGLAPNNLGSSFDVYTCFSILSDSGFTDHALTLALNFGYHQHYLKIQISRGASGAAACITYLAAMVYSCESSEVLPHIVTALPRLLRENPAAITGLLISICSGDYSSVLSMLKNSKISGVAHSSSSGSSSSSTAYHPSGSSRYRADLFTSISNNSESILAGPLTLATVKIPTAPYPIDEILSFYVGYKEYMQSLIEGVYSGKLLHQCKLPEKVAHILLELYLEDYDDINKKVRGERTKTTLSGGSGDGGRGAEKTAKVPINELMAQLKAQEEKVMSILDGHSEEYVFDRALLLTQSFRFEVGTRYLLEKTASTDLLLQSCMDLGDKVGIKKLLRREGSKEPELCIRVLTYFVDKASQTQDGGDSDDDDEAVWDDVTEVLSVIEQKGALSPTQVVSILSQNPKLPLQVALKYIVSFVREVNTKISDLSHEVKTTQHTIDSVLIEQVALKQRNGTGNAALLKRGNIARKGRPKAMSDDIDDDDLQEDLELQEQERGQEAKKWDAIRREAKKRSQDHEAFYSDIEHAVDGFQAIAKFFGNSVVL